MIVVKKQQNHIYFNYFQRKWYSWAILCYNQDIAKQEFKMSVAKTILSQIKTLAPTKLDGALVTVKKELDALKTLVIKVHQARGRYHSQLAMAALYEACGLPNTKPISREKS